MSMYINHWASEDEMPISYQDLCHARDHMELILEAAYDGTRSMEELDHSFEEVAAALDLKFCKEKKLKLQRKENPYFDLGVSLMNN